MPVRSAICVVKFGACIGATNATDLSVVQTRTYIFVSVKVPQTPRIYLSFRSGMCVVKFGACLGATNATDLSAIQTRTYIYIYIYYIYIYIYLCQ